ncbi:hypothetical protein CMT41_06555 [Colwellia sp. MT41]|uniref:hypothetical protein n=1 Tax=Colwellia sp. MT41 TaxID=58049 RepID=UPI000717755F|nr:hypothetical protein [Colwellia sp. MT41]ALO34418.1 hypothetical protein CMT41_06555 [Colwellia sp. MT41]
MKTTLITLVLVTLTMFGCGGDEADSEESNVVPQEIPATSPSTASQPQAVISTSELISTPEFNFISVVKLQLTLPASPTEEINYFINICTDFSNENDVVTINYKSCKLRARLTRQQQQFTLSLSVTEQVLIAQIWPIENDAQPITTYWHIAASGNNWQITF